MTHRGPRIGITIAALLALALYLYADEWWPVSVVSRIDTGALGLLALAFLPWLAYLVDEFKFGGFEGKLRSASQKADAATDVANAAKDAATDARAAAAEAIAAANEASTAAAEARAVAEDRPASVGAGEEALGLVAEATIKEAGKDTDILLALAKKYVKTRARKSGPDRTSRMTVIFTQMQRAAKLLGPKRSDVFDWLESPDSGHQLAAIAYLRNFPEAVPFARLVRVLQTATEAFVQYWALRVMHSRVDSKGLDGVSIDDRKVLHDLQAENWLGRATDRAIQLRALNHKLNPGN